VRAGFSGGDALLGAGHLRAEFGKKWIMQLRARNLIRRARILRRRYDVKCQGLTRADGTIAAKFIGEKRRWVDVFCGSAQPKVGGTN
jgi:hypothetical protein